MLRISLRKIQTLSAVAQTRAVVLTRQFSSVDDHVKFVADNQVTIVGTSTEEYPPFLSFDQTPFHPQLKKVLKKDNFESPSPIQAVSWPIALDKKDIISVAKTGSGKTLGFLLPGFQDILSKSQQPAAGARSDRGTFRRSHKAPQMLILAPTRELSNQIAAEATKYQSAGITTVSLYGGAHKGEQVRALRNGADVVVATPGRCNDLIEDGAFDTSKIKYLVLDEADRMLDMGFEPQIRQIIDQLPHSDEDRQTLFFTATWPREVQQLAREFLKDPVQVNIGNQDSLNANKDIKQNIISTKGFLKNDALLDLLEQKINPSANPKSLPKTIIFTATKSSCDELAMELRRTGYSAAALHGDKTQAMRDDAMRAFRNNRVSILIATDIAARGLDVKDIENVINYDFPNNTEDYVHRIGRTARGGATGTSYTFLTNKDLDNRRNMSDLVGVLKRCEQEVPEMLEGFAKGNSRYSEQRTTAFGGGRGGPRGGGGGGKFGRGGGDRGGDRFGDRYGPIGGGRSERSERPERAERGDRFGGGGGGGDRAERGDRFGGGSDRFGGDRPRSNFGGDRYGGDKPRSSRDGGFRAPRFAEQGDDEFALSGGSFTKRVPSSFSAPSAPSTSSSSSFGFRTDEFAELEELRRSHSARKAGPF